MLKNSILSLQQFWSTSEKKKSLNSYFHLIFLLWSWPTKEIICWTAPPVQFFNIALQWMSWLGKFFLECVLGCGHRNFWLWKSAFFVMAYVIRLKDQVLGVFNHVHEEQDLLCLQWCMTSSIACWWHFSHFIIIKTSTVSGVGSPVCFVANQSVTT